ncbi:MAG: hypothetical protein U9Q97_01345 [Acidobacteriota bacterium]|nr:hypothetical protein [Acidobacteriota bacterium]
MSRDIGHRASQPGQARRRHWEGTVHDVATQTFRGTLARMKNTPELTFVQSQTAIYEAIEKNYPEFFPRSHHEQHRYKGRRNPSYRLQPAFAVIE